MRLNSYRALNSISLDLAALILRIVGGGFMMNHGFPKMMSYSERSQNFPDPLGVGSEISLGLVVFAEFFCALFVLIGYKMRFALVPLMITMAVAAFIIHAGDPFGDWESSLSYLLIYLALFFTGSGKFSADKYIK